MWRRIILIVLLPISGCSYFDQYEYDIDPEIQKYVNSFILEAELRGSHFSDRNIRVQFASRKNGAQGHASRFRRLVTIDKNSSGWRNNPEALVFHELAHLFLRRDHDNSMYGRFPKSIMNAGLDPVWELQTTEKRRSYYIDELFNPDTPRPEWSFE